MNFSIQLPSFGVHASTESIIRAAQAADGLGYYCVWVAERLLVPIPPNQPWSQVNPTAYEPLITLACLATATKRVKLGTSVLIAPFRNPLVLARQAATLDQFSGGRLILGLGLGWMVEEFVAAGIYIKQRGRRTDELIDLLRHVWQSPQASFEGRFTKFGPSRIEPKPIAARVPIWIGGNSDAALRRTVARGDGWTPSGLDTDRLGERIDFLKAEADAQQRPMEQIAVSFSGPFSADKDGIGRMHESLETIQKLGVSHFNPSFEFENVEELTEQMRRFASEVMPSFQ